MASAPSTLSRSVASVWRTLRSMRTALFLLLLVALGSVAGSLVPQVGNSPARIAALYRDRPLLARVYEALGLFDVYGSWWFTLLYVLLLISLASCLIPRSRALLRNLGQRAQPLRDLGGMRHFASGVLPEPPGRALDRARRLLRRRRYRVSGPDGTAGGLAAEKGMAREVGSLVFHWSFFLLLLGVAYGKGAGFTGAATVIEGETWTEAHASYDVPPREGRFFRESMHAGFQIRVREFDVTYRDSGLPKEFVSRVDILDRGRPASSHEIRVNDPLGYRGVKVYQSGYGWAPVIEVRQDGRLLASEPVVFFTDDPQDQRVPWRGVVKLPSLRPQVGLELRLLPDPEAFLLGAPMLEARNPFLAFTAYRGDLRLTAAQSVFSLDKTGLMEWQRGGIGRGETARLPDGLEISFPELRQYTQFLVKRDPGLGIILWSAVLLLGALLPALYSSRRRVWVRVEPEGEGSRLEVAGFALQRKAAFEEEFDALARALVRTGPAERPDTVGVP
jgi:cytochrome c biogenesis protein